MRIKDFEARLLTGYYTNACMPGRLTYNSLLAAYYCLLLTRRTSCGSSSSSCSPRCPRCSPRRQVAARGSK